MEVAEHGSAEPGFFIYDIYVYNAQVIMLSKNKKLIIAIMTLFF